MVVAKRAVDLHLIRFTVLVCTIWRHAVWRRRSAERATELPGRHCTAGGR